MREKDQPKEGTHSSLQPVAGSPADLDKSAQNENLRANENIRNREGQQESSRDVGSEITDGEDAYCLTGSL